MVKHIKCHTVEELKPCPFCGGKAELIRSATSYYCHVTCPNCGVFTAAFNLDETAIEAWNLRRKPVIEAED